MKREELGLALARVRQRAPRVQCITNFVTVNDCANIILAVGGSASMARDVREAAEAVQTAQALVCNMGAIQEVDSMLSAGRRANELAIPVVLDPVAVGGTALRREAAARLLDQVRFAVIRGNASEIRYLAGQTGVGQGGVDAASGDGLSADNLAGTADAVRDLARRTGAVVVLSGVTDLVTDGTKTLLIRNGCATMSRITGSGCMLSSLAGTFCGAGTEPFPAAAAAVAAMGVCGEIAEEKRLAKGTGSATFRTDLIDAVFSLTEEELEERARYEVYER